LSRPPEEEWILVDRLLEARRTVLKKDWFIVICPRFGLQTVEAFEIRQLEMICVLAVCGVSGGRI
jgi:hypothetical protein